MGAVGEVPPFGEKNFETKASEVSQPVRRTVDKRPTVAGIGKRHSSMWGQPYKHFVGMGCKASSTL